MTAIDYYLVFDSETTGVSVSEDRLVTAYVALLAPDGHIFKEQDFVINPGIPIPEEAAQVHGYTTERVLAEASWTPAEAVEELHSIIRQANGAGFPLVGANLSYDLSLLEAERRRHIPEIPPLTFHESGDVPSGICVLDSLVLDRRADRWRRGSRKLVDTARHYGIEFSEDEAHQASFDAVAAGGIVRKLLQRDEFRGMSYAVLHEAQVHWRREQQEGLRAWFLREGNEDAAAGVRTEWPVIPA